ncbi:MAG TPA: YraN family protein [bacterium]|jgi:putative endonuclease|nr:YraN family protein [bacterium]
MGKPKRVSTHQRGKKAEELAAAFLRLKGYGIVERNFRVSAGEIDLIVEKGGTLVFVEVKSRKGRAQGTPLEAVSPHKVRRLSAAAAVYLAQKAGLSRTCRFDVITIGPDKNWLGLGKIRHFENAFSVEEYFNV